MLTRIRAGDLRHRVTIQSFSDTADTFGQVAPSDETTWTNVATVRGGIKTQSGREQIQGEQVNPELTHILTIRYRDDITAENRVLYPKQTTTLGAAISTTGETSITLAAAVAGSTSDVQRIRINNEFMVVTGGQGTTSLTVTRGAYGSTATTHSNGDAVQFFGLLHIETVRNFAEQNVMLQLDCIERP